MDPEQTSSLPLIPSEQFAFVASSLGGTGEAWCAWWVLQITVPETAAAFTHPNGPLPDNWEDQEAEIFKAIERFADTSVCPSIHSEGCGAPGSPFAHRPTVWMRPAFRPQPHRSPSVLVYVEVHQIGGLDV